MLLLFFWIYSCHSMRLLPAQMHLKATSKDTQFGMSLLAEKTVPFTKTGGKLFGEFHHKFGNIFRTRNFLIRPFIVTGLDNLNKIWKGEHDIVESEVPAPLVSSLAGRGIFREKGEEHKQLRHQLDVAFSEAAVNAYIPTIQSIVEDYFKELVQPKTSHTCLGVDISKKLSFVVALEAILGFEREKWVSEESYARISKLFRTVQEAKFALPLNLPGAKFRRALKAKKEVLHEIEKNILTIQSNIIFDTPITEESTTNVISRLLNLTNEDSNKLSIERMKDILYTLYEGGYEPVGYTLTAILAALGHDYHSMNELRKEQQQIFEKYGDKLNEHALHEMVFTESIIKEILRNASPEPGDEMRSITMIGVRKTLKPIELEGYSIPKGSRIITNSAYMHHHDSRWENATDEFAKTKFCPMRWLSDQGKKTGEFFPFGSGARHCVGSHFAMTELKIILAVLARNYTWTLFSPAETNWKSDPFPYPEDYLPLRIERI